MPDQLKTNKPWNIVLLLKHQHIPLALIVLVLAATCELQQNSILAMLQFLTYCIPQPVYINISLEDI